jgi:hypothetical protein
MSKELEYVISFIENSTGLSMAKRRRLDACIEYLIELENNTKKNK